MPRTARAVEAGGIYHVLNRGNGRLKIFHKPGDYDAFIKLLVEAKERASVDVLALCLMPNHWHLVLRPTRARDLAEFMRWLCTAHVRRHHAHYNNSAGGHLYQGRYKSFAIQDDEHFLTVCRYIEANPRRAEMVQRAEDWQWSSLGRGDARYPLPMAAWPVDKPRGWARLVNDDLGKSSLDSLRTSIRRGRPFGDDAWVTATAARLGITSSLRSVGRPTGKPAAGRNVRRSITEMSSDPFS